MIRQSVQFVFILSLLCSPPAMAQMMQGPWVEESDQKIDALRKTDLRVIVLDRQGKAVVAAAVTIEQLRHDFTIGFVLGEQGFAQGVGDKPVWWCFNAVSLQRLTAWPRLQPSPLVEPDFTMIDEAVDTAMRMGLRVRWGGLISADIGRNPDWVAFLSGAKLTVALDHHVKSVLLRFGSRVDAFDLYTHILDHQFIEDRLGKAMVRRLHEHAHAAAPDANIAAPLENSLVESRLRKSITHVRQLNQQFIPFNEVSISQRIGGMLLQRQLARGLELLGQFGTDVVISSLEVGGGSDATAANNLETLLRTLFATESIRGIYFSGMKIGDVADVNAALIDNAGRATRPGAVVDGLFHDQWWTNQTLDSDEMGNVYLRVFTGTHRITAALADGSALQTTVHLTRDPPPGLATHIVLLEPMKKTVD